MAKKVSRRERKRQQETKSPASPHQLLQQGRQELEAGNPRQALDYLKRAQREDNSLIGLNLLLFCAYSLRARQLAAKGMTTEAATMRNLASGQRLGIDPQALSADDFLWYIRHLDISEAIQVYASCLDRGESTQQVEQILADQLVVSRCWDALAGLGEDHPLRRDSPIVKQAIVLMDAGAWEEAGAALTGISRRSPYAPWRLFGKAMTCFGARDDRGLAQALDLLPKHFVLSQVVEELRRVSTPEPMGKVTSVSTAAQKVLATASVDSERLARELVAAIKRGPSQVRHVERLLPPLARAIYPEDPIEAGVALLEIIGISGRQHILPLANILALGRLLPPERAQTVAARIELINQPTSHRFWHVVPAETYLAHPEVEFPEAHQQSLARAQVLEFLARSGHKEGACPDCVGPQVIKMLWDLIGEHSDSPDMIFADLMLASLEIDPDNREGYRFLLDLLQGKTWARPRIESTLTEMAARFPDDPDPYLELARLHYSQNAYRKAETALEEARKRAPHDERILDRQAIAYLISADRSRNRRSYELAERDLRRAEALGRRRVASILLVKRLGLELLASGPGAVAKIGHHLDTAPPFDQLRSLALLILDLARAKYVDQRTLTKLRMMLNRKKALLDQLSTGEVVRLLAPIDVEFDLLFGSRWVAPVMSDWWTELMARIAGDDLIALFDILLSCQRRSVVRAEISRRLKGVATLEGDLLLRFYLAVILYLEGESYGSRGFQVIVDAADSAGKERLQAAATRLVPYTHGRLREALQLFEFDILDSPFASNGIGSTGIEELLGNIIGERGPAGIEGLLENLAKLMGNSGGLNLDENEDDDDDEIDELADLEEILDEAGLRGAPLPVLQDFVGVFRSDSQRRRELDLLARANEGRYDDLSRELRVLLFPRRSGSRRRTR